MAYLYSPKCLEGEFSELRELEFSEVRLIC
jgi:hypothetical protein